MKLYVLFLETGTVFCFVISIAINLMCFSNLIVKYLCMARNMVRTWTLDAAACLGVYLLLAVIMLIFANRVLIFASSLGLNTILSFYYFTYTLGNKLFNRFLKIFYVLRYFDTPLEDKDFHRIMLDANCQNLAKSN